MQLDFEEAGNLLEARDAVAINIEDEDVKPENQRKATGFTPDDDPLGTDDKTEVRTRLVFNENVYVLRILMFLHQIVILII